jgi:hypothetical protein
LTVATRLTDREKRALLKLLRDAHGSKRVPWEKPLPPAKSEKLAIIKKVELGLPLDGCQSTGERGYIAEALRQAWLLPKELNAYRRQRRRHYIETQQHLIKLLAKAAGTTLAADDVDYVVAKLFGFKSIEALRRALSRERKADRDLRTKKR